MKISDLEIDCSAGTCVKVWAECRTTEDIDDIIAWLQLSKVVMIEWGKINAKASQAPKAPTGQHETSKRREVLGSAQI